MVDPQKGRGHQFSGTFEPLEPLPAGDRQRQKRMSKARNPLQSGSFEVSLS
jgi:hypothetical protein